MDEQRGESAENLFDITMDISGMRSAQRVLRAIAMSTRERGLPHMEQQEQATDDPDPQAAVLPFQGGVIHVPVPGGSLAVELASGKTAPVLAIHGITSQRRHLHEGVAEQSGHVGKFPGVK